MAVSLEPIGDSDVRGLQGRPVDAGQRDGQGMAPLNVTCNTLSITAIKTDMLAQLPAIRSTP
jgi:3-oxoacyl-[acyl-carrier protein] reductase